MSADANWVCELESDDLWCACSSSGEECCCIKELLCAGPLVGVMIAPEYECSNCGAAMVAIDVNTGERLDPQPETLS